MYEQRIAGGFQGHSTAKIGFQKLPIPLSQMQSCFLQKASLRVRRDRSQEDLQIQLVKERQILPRRQTGQRDLSRLIGAVLAGQGVAAPDADF